jgi:hypothetical protein
MFSDLMDLDDAHRYVADPLAGMDARYDLGDDHRFVATLCPDMKLRLERPDPDVVTAVNRSADLLREGVGPCSTSSTAWRPATPWPRAADGSTPSPPARAGWTSTRCSSGPTASSPGPCPPAGPRPHHAGACAGHMVRPTGLSTALTVVQGSLGTK